MNDRGVSQWTTQLVEHKGSVLSISSDSGDGKWLLWYQCQSSQSSSDIETKVWQILNLISFWEISEIIFSPKRVNEQIKWAFMRCIRIDWMWKSVGCGRQRSAVETWTWAPPPSPPMVGNKIELNNSLEKSSLYSLLCIMRCDCVHIRLWLISK